jgi:acetyl esterase/lipase
LQEKVTKMGDIKATQTVVYKTVGELQISLDLYLPEDAQNAPVFLWFHGGGLLQGHRSSLTPSMRRAVQKYKLAVISADYRLAPQATVEEILSDVQDCVTFIRNDLSSQVSAGSIDTTRLAVSGSSAGGYLALLAGLYIEPKPNVIVPIYPITDPLGEFFTKPQPPAMGRPFVELETVAPFLDPKSPQVANNEPSGARSSMYIRMQHDANLAKLLRIPEGKEADKWRLSRQIYARRTPPAYVLHGDAGMLLSVVC